MGYYLPIGRTILASDELSLATFSDRDMQRQQLWIRTYVELFIQGLKSKFEEDSQGMTTSFN